MERAYLIRREMEGVVHNPHALLVAVINQRMSSSMSLVILIILVISLQQYILRLKVKVKCSECVPPYTHIYSH